MHTHTHTHTKKRKAKRDIFEKRKEKEIQRICSLRRKGRHKHVPAHIQKAIIHSLNEYFVIHKRKKKETNEILISKKIERKKETRRLVKSNIVHEKNFFASSSRLDRTKKKHYIKPEIQNSSKNSHSFIKFLIGEN